MWWMWGLNTGTPAPGTPPPVNNAPSLWSGGIRWGDPADAFEDGTDGYWGAVAAASGRSGKPELSIAIAGWLVTNQLQSASWSLGRPDWLSTLTATNASIEFVEVPVARVNDTVVVGLLSDAIEYHSDALWVGRVTSVRVRRDVADHVFSSIAATDVIGVLGQAKAPASLPAGHTLKTLTEELASDAGIGLQVDTDSLVTLPTLGAVTDFDGTVLDLVNRAERSSNALLFLRGNGRLYAAARDTTGASAVPVVNLDDDNAPAGWVEETSLQNVVTRWQLGSGDTWSTDTAATTIDEYGEHTYSATDLLITDPAPYANLIASDVMAEPRPIVVEAPFPVTDLSQKVLYLDPLDRVLYDGTWQVMSVEHDVQPGAWRMGITADATQEALAGAAEPGPVTPPALNQQTLTYTSTKGATASLTSGGTGGGTALGDLAVGKIAGTKYRSSVEWAISWPVNTIRVVSASVRLVTSTTADDPRLQVRRVTESWTEGGMTWGGPSTTTAGMRTVNAPRAAGKILTINITSIAQAWFETGNNYGISLRSVNEDTSSRAVSFYSDDASTAADRPILTIIVEVVS